MSRKTREIRVEHEERWPRLCQFLGAYLHQDWQAMYQSPWGAVEHAIADYDLIGLKAVASDWWTWNASRSWRGNLRATVNDGLGVNLRFDSDLDARQFMNEVYERVIVQIRREDKYWRPGKGS